MRSRRSRPCRRCGASPHHRLRLFDHNASAPSRRSSDGPPGAGGAAPALSRHSRQAGRARDRRHRAADRLSRQRPARRHAGRGGARLSPSIRRRAGRRAVVFTNNDAPIDGARPERRRHAIARAWSTRGRRARLPPALGNPCSAMRVGGGSRAAVDVAPSRSGGTARDRRRSASASRAAGIRPSISSHAGGKLAWNEELLLRPRRGRAGGALGRRGARVVRFRRRLAGGPRPAEAARAAGFPTGGVFPRAPEEPRRPRRSNRCGGQADAASASSTSRTT